MSTQLTGYNNSITADDTYILGCVDPMARKTIATIMLTASGGYPGTATIQGRPKGSSKPFQVINYAKPPGSAVAASAITPPAIIEVDATGKDIAIVTTGGLSTGALQIDVSIADQY
jgi:hypothetical protein